MKSDPLRTMKTGGIKCTVCTPKCPAADNQLQLAVEIRHHNAIVIAVGDKQAASFFVGQYFARESKWRIFTSLSAEDSRSRSRLQQALSAVVRQSAVDHGLHLGKRPLAARGPYN